MVSTLSDTDGDTSKKYHHGDERQSRVNIPYHLLLAELAVLLTLSFPARDSPGY